MNISIEVELRCGKCGSDLNATNNPHRMRITVEPCQVCIGKKPCPHNWSSGYCDLCGAVKAEITGELS